MAARVPNPGVSPAPGTVITFYSFKGGVGRSMALANVAVLLARAGKRVLCLDWDLEAPGLDRYFRAVPRANPSAIPHVSAPAKTGGLLAILETSTAAALTPWRDYTHTRTTTDAPLDFIGSGDDAESYTARLAAFTWAEFFAQREGGAIIEALRTEWKAAYDYILVDSRTGLTDASGICTIQMPDLLVLLFAANEQNTHWCERIARSIRAGRRELPYERAFLPIIPLLARFDAREESDRAAAAKDRIAPLFAGYFADWLPASITARAMLDWSLLPYVPRYNFEEALAVEEEPSAGPQGLSFYYDLLARLILARFQGVRAILASVGVTGAALPPLLPGATELRKELRSDTGALGRYAEAIKARAAEEPLEAVEAFEELARLCESTSRPLEGVPLLEAATGILRDPAVGHSEEVPRLLSRQADLLAAAGHSADAEALHLEAVRQATESSGEHSPHAAHAREAFAGFLMDASRRAEAVNQLSLAVAAYDRSSIPDPAALRSALDRWVDLLFALGRHPEAIPIARRALDLVQADPDRDPLDEALAFDQLGTALRLGGDPRGSVGPVQKALALEEAAAGSDQTARLGRALNNLAMSLSEAGRYAEAEPLYRRALAIDEKVLGPEHPNVAAICGNLAWVVRATGRHAEAEPLYRRALAIVEKALGPEHPNVAAVCGNLAWVLRDTGRYAEAEPLYRRALAIDEKILGPEHPYVGISLVYLAQALSEAGRGAEAENLWRRGCELLERGYGPAHDRVGRARWRLAEHLERTGRRDAARAEIALALRILKSSLGSDHPDTIDAAAVAARMAG